MSIGMRMPLAAALALCACASSQRTLVLDLRPLHGAAGREVRVDPDEVRVYNRDRPILTLWARSPEDPRCAAGAMEEPGDFGGPTSIGMKLCPAGTGQDGWASWHVDVSSSGRSLRSLPMKFDYEVALAPDGSELFVRYPGSAAQVSLPPGPIAEAVKQHPELLGAVVAANLAPLAPDGRYRLVRR